MSLAILFHFLCDQHVSDINISIIRSLPLFCWITTLVVLFLVRCVLEFRCGWAGVVSVLQLCFSLQHSLPTTPTQPHRNSNTHRTKNNTTNFVIQQNSRKFLLMDILMSETCWSHKKWNKIASDIKLVFYSSTITMMRGPINIRFFRTVRKWKMLNSIQSFRILHNTSVFLVLGSHIHLLLHTTVTNRLHNLWAPCGTDGTIKCVIATQRR